MFLKEEKIV